MRRLCLLSAEAAESCRAAQQARRVRSERTLLRDQGKQARSGDMCGYTVSE